MASSSLSALATASAGARPAYRRGHARGSTRAIAASSASASCAGGGPVSWPAGGGCNWVRRSPGEAGPSGRAVGLRVSCSDSDNLNGGERGGAGSKARGGGGPGSVRRQSTGGQTQGLSGSQDSYLLGGRKNKGGGQGRPPGGPVPEEEEAAAGAVATPRTPKERIRFALKQIDEDGYWAVISSGIVFGTFLLETYNVSKFGGWDVLYRDDIPWYTGLISMEDLIDIEDAYNALFFFEFCLRAWAADFKLAFWSNPVTLVDLVATIPPVLSFLDLAARNSPVFRFLRLARVLRLLRLLDRSPKSVLFGLVRSDSMGIQLVGIGAEFVCIFIIAAGVIYDLEYDLNPNVHSLNDTLYWAILTLTGIGQPFEVVTSGGRIATVLSILVAGAYTRPLFSST